MNNNLSFSRKRTRAELIPSFNSVSYMLKCSQITHNYTCPMIQDWYHDYEQYQLAGAKHIHRKDTNGDKIKLCFWTSCMCLDGMSLQEDKAIFHIIVIIFILSWSLKIAQMYWLWYLPISFNAWRVILLVRPYVYAQSNYLFASITSH